MATYTHRMDFQTGEITMTEGDDPLASTNHNSTDAASLDSEATPTAPTTTTATAAASDKPPKRTSYLLSYLQKSELFASQNPKTSLLLTDEALSGPGGLNAAAKRFSLDSSFGSSSPTDSSREDGEDEEDDEDDYDEDEDGIDPDDLTNMPYKSPLVYELPGPRNAHKFRTLVREGPVGSREGENQRFVVIAKRSFRGAGLWPAELVKNSMSGGDMEMDDYGDGEEDYEDYDEEDRGLEGEVEVMWSDDGEEFWLVRDPANDGSIGKETSWVKKEWFLRRRSKVSRPTGGRERVELRVMMEED